MDASLAARSGSEGFIIAIRQVSVISMVAGMRSAHMEEGLRYFLGIVKFVVWVGEMASKSICCGKLEASLGASKRL